MKFCRYMQFLMLLIIAGCSPEKGSEKPTITAGLPPVAGIASIIAGDRVSVISILPQGRTPHDFAPRTQTMRDASNSALFFSTGMPFENKIAKFMQDNGKKVADISRGISRIAFHDGGDHQHEHQEHSECSHDDHDPHLWLSCANALIIAGNIKDELISIDPAGKDFYLQNYKKLRSKLENIDREISAKLQPHQGKTFFVYHPAFGYFAAAYKLKQRAIELNGREASAPQLAKITREAREAGVTTIFVQEQFNPGSAAALARQINGNVIQLDPLAMDLIGNMQKIADALNAGFNSQTK